MNALLWCCSFSPHSVHRIALLVLFVLTPQEKHDAARSHIKKDLEENHPIAVTRSAEMVVPTLMPLITSFGDSKARLPETIPKIIIFNLSYFGNLQLTTLMNGQGPILSRRLCCCIQRDPGA